MNVNDIETKLATETYGATAIADPVRGPGWHSYSYVCAAGTYRVWSTVRRGWAVALLKDDRFQNHDYYTTLEDALMHARIEAGGSFWMISGTPNPINTLYPSREMAESVWKDLGSPTSRDSSVWLSEERMERGAAVTQRTITLSE